MRLGHGDVTQPGRDGGQELASSDLSAMTLKTAPKGSVTVEKRPGSMSIGGMSTVPPRSAIRATAASVSSTAKYPAQNGGTSAGIIGGFCIIPATDRPFTCHSVYSPVGPAP